MLTARQHAATAGQPTSNVSAANFDTLPDSAFIRESQLVQSPKRPDTRHPALQRPDPVAQGEGRHFPQPVKLSERVTAWNVGAVRA